MAAAVKSRVGPLALLALAIAAAAAEAHPVTRAEPMRARPGYYSCGTLPVPRRNFDAPRGAERSRTPPALKLREALRRAGRNVPRRGWHVLTRSDRIVEYSHTTHRPPLRWVVTTRRERGRWVLDDFRTCTPHWIVRGFTTMSWAVVSGLSPTSTRLTLRIRAGGCLRRETDFRRVEVTYGGRSVNLLVLYRRPFPPPRPGEPNIHACPADLAFHERDVLLPAPIGSREVADARTWPPTRIPRTTR